MKILGDHWDEITIAGRLVTRIFNNGEINYNSFIQFMQNLD